MAKQRQSGARPEQKLRRKRRKFPIEIWAGGSLIRILRDPLLIPIKPRVGQKPKPGMKPRKKKYDSYLVEHYIGSERMRERRGALEKAMALADSIKIKLLNNEVEATRLAGRDLRIYQAAAENLKGVALQLDHVARDFAQAAGVLKPHDLGVLEGAQLLASILSKLNGTPLPTVLDFYDRHGRNIRAEKTVPEVLEEMLKAKKADNVGDYHIRDLRLRAGYFAKSFPGKILHITTPQINEWLRGLRSRSKKDQGALLSGTTRNNYRDSVVELFNYAKANGYLSAEMGTAADRTKAVKEITAENEIFTPEEMTKLVSGAPPHMVPTMAVKAFSGVRTEEVVVLRWQDIRFERDCIIMPKGITKLDQRRLIPLKPNLKAWLLPYRKPEGRICETWTLPNSVAHAWKRHGNSVGIGTGKNKFRNSYISYRVAETADPKTVAFESGNSEEVIRRDYLEVATPEEAVKWFSIYPEGDVAPKGKQNAPSSSGKHLSTRAVKQA